MGTEPIPPSDQPRSDQTPSRVSLFLALISAFLVLLTLYAALTGEASTTTWSLFLLAVAAIIWLLLNLYRTTMKSSRSPQLRKIRLHIIMHFVPMVYFGLSLGGISFSWLNLISVILLAMFFLSGRVAWAELGEQYPSTLLYQIFYRGNTAFMTSFPVLYLVTLLFPQSVDFDLIEKVAVFYFSIHFILLGVSCLKIESDLRSAS